MVRKFGLGSQIVTAVTSSFYQLNTLWKPITGVWTGHRKQMMILSPQLLNYWVPLRCLGTTK